MESLKKRATNIPSLDVTGKLERKTKEVVGL
jgi:hypothetical protein